MEYLAICNDDLLFQFMRRVSGRQGEILFLVQDPGVVRRIRRSGARCLSGPLDRERSYKKVRLEGINQAIIFVRDTKLRKRVITLLRSLRKGMPILLLSFGQEASLKKKDPLIREILLEDVFQEFCAPQLLNSLNRQRVDRIRSLFGEKDKIFILLQHDPDPDAIGSALALRELLGRNRATTPIVTFGEVTRPENLAMLRLLEIQI
ncbi:MAG: bifunctional oligoribonuclease/PAP phosphatase NrnA, partial [Candidatus Binatia bacterium]